MTSKVAAAARSVAGVNLSAKCVPGTGMILWGESPLYLIWKGVILTTLKVLAESKAWEGDRPAERSWSANP